MRAIHQMSLAAIGICTGILAFAAAPEITVIEHVTVLPMTINGEVIKDATVTLRGDRIDSLAASSAAVSTKVQGRVINGRGKWLMPALADMHVHLENDRLARLYFRDPSIPAGTVQTADALLPYVANGVLQIAVLGAMSETIAQRDEVESG